MFHLSVSHLYFPPSHPFTFLSFVSSSSPTPPHSAWHWMTTTIIILFLFLSPSLPTPFPYDNAKSHLCVDLDLDLETTSLPPSLRFWCWPFCNWEGRVQVPAQSCSRINVPALTLAAVWAHWSRHGAFVRTCHASSHYTSWALLIFCSVILRFLNPSFSP